MLNKRVQILFDEQLANELIKHARKSNVSVGEFVRSAVEKELEQEKVKKQRMKAVDAIREFREKYGEMLAKGEDSLTIIHRLREERTKHLLSLAESEKNDYRR